MGDSDTFDPGSMVEIDLTPPDVIHVNGTPIPAWRLVTTLTDEAIDAVAHRVVELLQEVNHADNG